ncbi:hypothetical protein Tco_1093006 [Tanacetum coccineum]|uniref:CCHC-type domain-containing protein n=1 Tax=Tanacetum coccineum TaxID=301880 RepID=A0ABQ5IBG0_9ASTR
MSSYNQRECVGCGQPCDGFYCYLCTCQQCGVNLINGICLNCIYRDGKPATCCGCKGPLNSGFCSFCASRAGNSFAYDPNPNSFNDSQNLSDYPPQPQYQTYSCELCGNDAHYGYDCLPQVPFVYNQNPCFDQNFDNNFPQTSPSLPQQYLCCENCGGPHESFQCQPMNQNLYNSNSSGFDQLQPPQYPVIHNPPQETSVEILQAKEDLMKSIQTFLKKFNRISFGETPKVLLLAWEKFFEIQHAQLEDIHELLNKLLEDLQIISEELSEYINFPSWNRPTFNDDDDYTIQYKEYLENSSKAITHDLPIEEPDNSLSLGDKHLSTIPKTESDEVTKSSVEDLVLILSESEGISDDTCDVPFCDNSPIDVLNDHIEIFSDFHNDCTLSDDDSFEEIDYVEASPPDYELVSLEEVKEDILHEKLLNIDLLIAFDSPSSDEFSPISIFEEKSVTFSNPLFDSNDDFTSSDEDVPEENIKIYSNPLFEFDDGYISSDVNPLFDEVLEDIKCKDSYDSNLDESTFLVTPLSNSNKDECFTPSDDVELLLHHDPSISVVSILEGFTNESPLKENDDFFDLESKENDWKKILYDAPFDDLISEDKVFDP